jgi:hypothetical protein
MSEQSSAGGRIGSSNLYASRTPGYDSGSGWRESVKTRRDYGQSGSGTSALRLHR